MKQSRASILLECIIALAIFVAAATTIYSVIVRSVDAAERTARIERAADLARGAMAQIESGVGTPETLNGPVPEWRDEKDGTFDENAAASPWELQIESEPSEFEGLTMVRVRAVQLDPPGSDRVVASFQLAQLVRLSPEREEKVQEDPLAEAARRGAANEQRATERRTPPRKRGGGS
ncbi:MAG: hypothetical protein ACOYN0_06145 [Phycisphaerales bacterium]